MTARAWVRLWLEPDGQEVVGFPLGGGRCVAMVQKAPTRADDEPGEDAAGVCEWSTGAAALLLADGVGGNPGGDEAARLLIRSLADQLQGAEPQSTALRAALLTGAEQANGELLAAGRGAMTTMLAAVVVGDELRCCHAGDSELVVVGQRGRVKHRTISHSPVGYAVEAGVLEDDDSLEHEDRYLLSNCVGMAAMRLEVASAIRLAPRDTVVLASDGLWDNLTFDEVVEIVRKGSLESAMRALHARCGERMAPADGGEPAGKPDDLSVLLFRLG